MKKILKSALAASVCALAIMSSGTAVTADVLITPIGDMFFETFEDDCDYIEQRKYTVTEDCIVYDNPNFKNPMTQLTKGSVILSTFAFTDDNGVEWQNVMSDDGFTDNGWIKREFAEVIYDRFSFEEEHKEEYAEYAGELDDFVPEKTVYIWQYPGSGVIIDKYPADSWFTDPDYFLTVHDAALYSYIDENGDKWIYMGYNMWGWVYLPDPESTKIGETEAIAPLDEEYWEELPVDTEELPPETSISEISETAPSQTSFPATGYKMPVSMAIITGIISGVIIFFIRKKQDK